MSQTRRREFLATAGALLAAPIVPQVRAQEPGKVRVIGALRLDHAPTAEQNAANPAFALLQKHGWVEGKNFIFERRAAELKGERLAGFAEELVSKRVDIILTTGPEATLAAARATRTIPILFNSVIWPLEQGLIDSFAHPGRNATGVAGYTGVEVTNKRLEFLRAIAPAARRLAWLWPAAYTETLSGGRFDVAPVMGAAASKLGFETRFHEIREPKDIDAALADVQVWRAQAISASGSHVALASKRIADFALRNRLPTAFITRGSVEAGGLLYYGTAPGEDIRLISRWAAYFDRILRGANPADLPVEMPSQYELVVNLATAKALGLTVPQSVLLRADRVIE